MKKRQWKKAEGKQQDEMKRVMEALTDEGLTKYKKRRLATLTHRERRALAGFGRG